MKVAAVAARELVKLLRIVGVATGVALLLGLSGILWLRSDSGRERIRHRIAEWSRHNIRGELTIATISGSLLGNVTLQKVALRDRRGRGVMTARAVYAKYALGSLLWGRPRIDRVIVDGADIDLAAT